MIGPGANPINTHIIRRVTQGLANYLAMPGPVSARHGRTRRVAIAYDPYRSSAEFAEAAALVLAAKGITALVFDEIRPTPVFSFAVRALNCDAGIVITASHNPQQYNGYKVYGPDGRQAVEPLIDRLIRKISPFNFFDSVKTVERGPAAAAGLPPPPASAQAPTMGMTRGVPR